MVRVRVRDRVKVKAWVWACKGQQLLRSAAAEPPPPPPPPPTHTLLLSSSRLQRVRRFVESQFRATVQESDQQSNRRWVECHRPAHMHLPARMRRESQPYILTLKLTPDPNPSSTPSPNPSPNPNPKPDDLPPNTAVESNALKKLRAQLQKLKTSEGAQKTKSKDAKKPSSGKSKSLAARRPHAK